MNLSEMIKLSVKGGYARSCKGKILKVHDTKEKNKEKYVLPIERFNSLIYFFFMDLITVFTCARRRGNKLRNDSD